METRIAAWRGTGPPVHVLDKPGFVYGSRVPGAVAARQKQVAAGFNARGYGPEKVAKAIVESVVKNKAVRPVAPEAYLLYGTSRVAPQIMRSAARQKLI